MSVSREIQHIGLFGGTFDPVHQGHLALACHVLDRCRLDTLLFIPAPQPPHKGLPRVSFVHRAAMLEAALAECPDTRRVRISLIEQELPNPSYTINTVEALIERHGQQRFFLIIGADSLVDLPHWHRAPELLALTNLIVVRRDNIGRTEIDSVLHSLDSTYALDQQQDRWTGKSGNTVEYLADVQLPISSSAIREALARGEDPGMVPPAVLAYIQEHHLYGRRSPS